MGYLVPSVKGSKQLSASGEKFVEALPDRDAAKEILERYSRRAPATSGKKGQGRTGLISRHAPHFQKAKRLVFFNHKGGVGKTTLTVNLAYALVEAGKRVLVVDTDPQCSLSSFFLEEQFLDKMLDESETSEGNTLWSALRPVQRALAR